MRDSHERLGDMELKMRKGVWREKWVRLNSLDAGGQGRTYLARPVSSGDGAASHVLKELKHQSDAERRGRMHAEVASLERLNHAGIARFADSNSSRWNDDEELYLVTEYIPGNTLRQQVTTQPLSYEAAINCAAKLLDTLEYCHRMGIIHRDIKPENIVLRGNEPLDPVLIDFGLAYDEEIRPEDFATPTHQQIGNRFYALPEYRVAGSDKRDTISDVTLIVAILFYAVTGIDPEVPRDDNNLPPHRRRRAIEMLALPSLAAPNGNHKDI